MPFRVTGTWIGVSRFKFCRVEDRYQGTLVIDLFACRNRYEGGIQIFRVVAVHGRSPFVISLFGYVVLWCLG
jgi:hypothetical protein